MLKRFTDLLRGLFRTVPHDKGNQNAMWNSDLEKKVLDLVDNMPAMPEAAGRAIALADDPNVHMKDLGKLIEIDPAITTGILRVANSALYACGNEVTKLDQALSRLGLFQAKQLILSIAVKSRFRGVTGVSRQRCETLWQHGSTTATIAQKINREYRLGFRGEEYSAGLLHDLGRVLIAMADPESFSKCDPLDFCEDENTLDFERQAIGIDHAALGGWFAEQSQLPADLSAVIRFHHKPHEADSFKRLVALIATADHMANHIQRGEEPETYDFSTNIGLTTLCSDWPMNRWERLLGDLPVMMGECSLVPA